MHSNNEKKLSIKAKNKKNLKIEHLVFTKAILIEKELSVFMTESKLYFNLYRGKVSNKSVKPERAENRTAGIQ